MIQASSSPRITIERLRDRFREIEQLIRELGHHVVFGLSPTQDYVILMVGVGSLYYTHYIVGNVNTRNLRVIVDGGARMTCYVDLDDEEQILMLLNVSTELEGVAA